MNERIKELAEQAKRHADELYSLDVGMWSDAYEQKFAQLVLEDCFDILITYRTKVIFHDGFEYNCVHPITAISKHFGVE